MSGFLTRLIERQWGQTPTIQPRTRPTFAPDSGATSFQVVDDFAVFQPHANLQRAPSTHHAGPDEKLRHPSLEQQQSPGRSVRSSAPPVHQTFAGAPVHQAVERPSLGPVASAGVTADIERPLSAPPALIDPVPIDSMQMRPTPNVSTGARPTQRVGEVATASGTADTRSFTEVALAEIAQRPAPPLIAPLVQDPMAVRQQISAPASLHLETSESKRSSHAEPRVVEPPVHVTIGRIEVTAVTTPPVPKRAPSSRKASMPLQDYLAHRRGGKP